MSRSSRLVLGAHFSEGARLLWLAIQAEQIPAAQGAASIEADTGLFSRWLYGDRKPGREWASVVAARFGVPTAAWDTEPTEPFTTPAALAADETTLDTSPEYVDPRPSVSP